MQHSHSQPTFSSRTRNSINLRNTINGVRKLLESKPSNSSTTSTTLVARSPTAASGASTSTTTQIAKCDPDFLDLLASSHGGDYKLITGANAMNFYREYLGHQAAKGGGRNMPTRVVFAFTGSRSGKRVLNFVREWRRPQRRNSNGQMLDRAKKVKRRKAGFLDTEFDKVLEKLDTEFKRLSTAILPGNAEASTSKLPDLPPAIPSKTPQVRITTPPVPERRDIPPSVPDKDVTIPSPPSATAPQFRPQSVAVSVMSMPFLNALGRPVGPPSSRGPLLAANPDARSTGAGSSARNSTLSSVGKPAVLGGKHGLSPLNPNSQKHPGRVSRSPSSQIDETVKSEDGANSGDPKDTFTDRKNTTSPTRKPSKEKTRDGAEDASDSARLSSSHSRRSRTHRKAKSNKEGNRKEGDNKENTKETQSSSDDHEGKPKEDGDTLDTPKKPKRMKTKSTKEVDGSTSDHSTLSNSSSSSGNDTSIESSPASVHEAQSEESKEFLIVLLDEEGGNSWHGLGPDQLGNKSSPGGQPSPWWAPLVDPDTAPFFDEDYHSEHSWPSDGDSEDEDAPVVPWRHLDKRWTHVIRRQTVPVKPSSYSGPVDPRLAVHRTSSAPADLGLTQYALPPPLDTNAGSSRPNPGSPATVMNYPSSPYPEHTYSPVNPYQSPYVPIRYVPPIVTASDFPGYPTAAPAYVASPYTAQSSSTTLRPPSEHFAHTATDAEYISLGPQGLIPIEYKAAFHANPSLLQGTVSSPELPYSAVIPPGFVPYAISGTTTAGYAPPVVPYARYSMFGGISDWSSEGGRRVSDVTGFPQQA